ncbi:calcium dependent mitochondrial carrier protein-like protein [Tothia fuscella]|uniref:Mitochondrial thiamine pyrophosphate carrier 1 n=1 Tax=Tothia fuscella TaxID=1048955 RepID=A0A9P4NNL5_9PEZI|nr:calcium dependent mitochondrial carrier protein-like protein [Tothia fuscella]
MIVNAELESANSQDARIEELWRKLDTKGKGYLDLPALKLGLRKIDHPLKKADALLKDVLNAIDADSDGRISYAEFQAFVKQTEQELWSLFSRIDQDADGKLDKNELMVAFKTAGLNVSEAKLRSFMDEIDTNHDGSVDFAEWRNRDFLLFIPATDPNLNEILSYYSSTVRMNSEGDVVISDDIKQGIGTLLHFLKPFFASINLILEPPRSSRLDHGSSYDTDAYTPHSDDQLHSQQTLSHPQLEIDDKIIQEEDMSRILATTPRSRPIESDWKQRPFMTPVLIDRFPQLGYFVAGGAAGIVSRTTTAPLDRLKVYLIAQTDNTTETLRAAKEGNIAYALRGAWRTTSNAIKELWAAGGVRSLFAGNGLNVIKVMPESAIKFGSYEAIKTAYFNLGGNRDEDNIFLKFWAGGVSGMIAQFCVYPADTLKFRMQCETVTGGLRGNKLIAVTAQKMWTANGIRSYYRGVGLGVVGMFPYAAIDMGTYEFLKKQVNNYNARRLNCDDGDRRAQPGSLQMAFVGGFSGALGASMVYPLNVLRTRLQSQGTVLHPRRYTGIADVFRQTIKGEGTRGLYRGLAPNLLKVVPSVSMSWVVYENCKKELGLH